jgi:excisionase family DNA binding protein
MERTFDECQIVCVELSAWEMLKTQVKRLTSDVAALKELYCPTPRDGWIDSADVCRALGISKRTLQTWRNNGKIPFSMLGGKVYFHRSDINELLKGGMKHK